MLTVLSVIGTRPEAIKMAPVVQELARHSDRIRSVVCVTAQHRGILDQVLELFAIRPDYDLDVMRADQTLSGMTAELLRGIDVVLAQVRPDWVLAQGDTTTVFAAAMASHYHQIHFGHIEAGLRTGERYQPFPEEMNRRLADALACLLFAPTESSRQALLNEGCAPDDILITGNTVIDALLKVAARPYEWLCGPLAGIPNDHRIVLVTTHRRESFGKPLREICTAVRELAHQFWEEPIEFVFPVHPNPNVRQPVYEILPGLRNVHLLEPLDYVSFVHLMKHSTLILTDSGGVQEEAPSLGVPVLVMRDVTERQEGVEAGVVQIVGTTHERIIEAASALLCDPALHRAMARRANPYGDGRAAARIVAALLERAAR